LLASVRGVVVAVAVTELTLLKRARAFVARGSCGVLTVFAATAALTAVAHHIKGRLATIGGKTITVAEKLIAALEYARSAHALGRGVRN
jgi:hypothetical protein